MLQPVPPSPSAASGSSSRNTSTRRSAAAARPQRHSFGGTSSTSLSASTAGARLSAANAAAMVAHEGRSRPPHNLDAHSPSAASAVSARSLLPFSPEAKITSSTEGITHTTATTTSTSASAAPSPRAAHRRSQSAAGPRGTSPTSFEDSMLRCSNPSAGSASAVALVTTPEAGAKSISSSARSDRSISPSPQPQQQQQQQQSNQRRPSFVDMRDRFVELDGTIEIDNMALLLMAEDGFEDEEAFAAATVQQLNEAHQKQQQRTQSLGSAQMSVSSVNSALPTPTYRRFNPEQPAAYVYFGAPAPAVRRNAPAVSTFMVSELENDDDYDDKDHHNSAAAAIFNNEGNTKSKNPKKKSDDPEEIFPDPGTLLKPHSSVIARRASLLPHQIRDTLAEREASASPTPSPTSSSLALSAPAWPQFTPRLTESLNSATTAAQTSFASLFTSIPQSVLAAANNAMASSSDRAGAASSKRRKEPHQQQHTQMIMFEELEEISSSSDGNDDDYDDDDAFGSGGGGQEEEEMMEAVEAAPVRSLTHAAAASAPTAAVSASRKQYYFEQKQILDRESGTLENAVPMIVSAAVRAQQSPFTPWCSFNQDHVERNGALHAESVAKLLRQAHGVPSDNGNIMATPLSANAAWAKTGVRINLFKPELIIINPAVTLPEYVLRMADSALTFKFLSVTIRGMPKFERSAQTTLQLYHEVQVCNKSAKLELEQREQLARLGLASERAFWAVHVVALEQYNRAAFEHFSELMKKRSTNPLSLYYGELRERKGHHKMIVELLDVPTPDGRTIGKVLDEDQREDFDRAIALSSDLIERATNFCLPLQQLVKMELQARQQESRCYDAWVASMEHLHVLIPMSSARRCSVNVKQRLSTRTNLDDKIAQVSAALAASRLTLASVSSHAAAVAVPTKGCESANM